MTREQIAQLLYNANNTFWKELQDFQTPSIPWEQQIALLKELYLAQADALLQRCDVKVR